MRCFNHHDRDAFAIDITTGKALCLECLEEYKGKIIERSNENSKAVVDITLTGYEQIKQNKKVLVHNEKIMGMNSFVLKLIFFVLIIFTILLLISGIIFFLQHNVSQGVSNTLWGLLAFFISINIKKYI